MPGASFNVRIDGRVYAVPEDQEHMIIKGGSAVKAALRNGDGTAVPQMTRVQGAIKGLGPRCRIANGDFEALSLAAGKPRIDIDYKGPDGSYTGTGFIVSGDEGLNLNQSTGVVDPFDFICDEAPTIFRG